MSETNPNVRARSSDFAISVITNQRQNSKLQGEQLDSRIMRFSPLVFHSGLFHSHVDSVRGDRSDALFAVPIFFFFREHFYYIFSFV